MKKYKISILMFILVLSISLPVFSMEGYDYSIENNPEHFHVELIDLYRYPAHECHSGPAHDWCYEKLYDSDVCGCKHYEYQCCCGMVMGIRLKPCNTTGCINY